MTVKVLVSFITENGAHAPGDLLTTDDAVAQNWIDTGLVAEVSESE